MDEIREHDRRLEMQKKIIEEERQRLLQQHAPNLIGFLPKVRIQLMLFVGAEVGRWTCD